MKNTPDVSIVVSCWNAAEIIGESLESITATANDMNIDVTIIDDASTDGGCTNVDQKFKDDPRFTFIRTEKNVGIPVINMLLDRTDAKYIMMLDTDARLQPGALQALYAFMEAHPDAGAASANLRNPDGSAQLYYRRILTPSMYFFSTPLGRIIDKCFFGLRNYRWYHYSDLDITKAAEAIQPPFAGLMLRREAFGPYILDTRMPLFMCDIDLCRRIYNNGYKVYLVPEARVTHLKTASAVKRGKKWLDNELYRSYLIYFRKHFPLLFPFIWIAWVLDRVSRTILLRTVGREPLR